MGARERIVWRRRLLIAGTLTTFEALMPLVGMFGAGTVDSLLGESARYIAAVMLAGLGAYFLLHGDDEDEEAPTLVGMGALLALGVAVSIDEVAVGVSLGLAGVHPAPLVATVAVWVFTATMVGLTLGARLGRRFQSHAGTFAAVALIALGALLAVGVL
jgi:putative Mn2+ efflux pump MntP